MERHHNYLALAYADQILQVGEEMHLKTREKLQQHLWESKFYDISIVYGTAALWMLKLFLYYS